MELRARWKWGMLGVLGVLTVTLAAPRASAAQTIEQRLSASRGRS